MFRGRKGAAGDSDVVGHHRVNRDGAAPDMAIYGGNAFGHSVSPTAHLFGELTVAALLHSYKSVIYLFYQALSWLFGSVSGVD